jgi:hypothetical protein
MGFFNELGAKRTLADPDGSKHRLGFRIFILVMLLVIGTLILVNYPKNDAQAGTYRCRGPISAFGPSDDSPGNYWVKLTVQRWCGSPAGWDGGPPGFDRTYGEGPIAEFERWFDTKTEQGTGVAPNGTRGVKYKAIWIAAEFKICVGVGPARVCQHRRPEGVRFWAWANGNYTVTASHAVPNTVGGMPRP